jgi:hypothetical protein
LSLKLLVADTSSRSFNSSSPKTFIIHRENKWSLNSSVGIATGFGLDGRGSIHAKGQESLLHSVQNAPYPMHTRVSFFVGKAAGA